MRFNEDSLLTGRPSIMLQRRRWCSQTAFCRARQTFGYRRRSTTTSDCSSGSFLKESRSTEIDSIEPPQQHHFSTTWRRPRVLMKEW
jgi:hypothetical protein